MEFEDTPFLWFDSFKYSIFEARYRFNFAYLRTEVIPVLDGIRVKGVKESLVSPMKFVQIICNAIFSLKSPRRRLRRRPRGALRPGEGISGGKNRVTNDV